MQTAMEIGNEDPNSKERRIQKEGLYGTVSGGWS